ncbi:MAG: 2-succinyl-5-enolpyruvyl-6-hydroxy-3-cyclohexene-1-carboxylic-acid synthase [Opitutaceae bacterium]|nr:2-succinyl-5-enolpyruvyl-6-hydroxy-3-cyclohexene-1-carboxylic-acid synthase [Opitutaceae bacterium]
MTPATLDFRNPNSLWCSVLVETLVRLGLRQVVISPGSRSTPLTIAFVRHPRIEAIPVLDERSAAFFALGLAKQRGTPVALVCTSGTAGANYFPAIIEAHESGVPLLVLTADRPPELRDCHSGQTIDQQKLYGGYVNFYHELAVPEAKLELLRYLRQTVAHAYAMSVRSAHGPVHLNCPFRDPLPPVARPMPAGMAAPAFADFFTGLEEAGRQQLPLGDPIGPKLADEPNGVIVVGPNDPVDSRLFAQSIGRLSRALGWPVLADALSPVRMHAAEAGHVVAHYDAILRSEKLANALRPKRVICIGAWPTSKVLRSWLQESDPETVMVTDHAGNLDALHLRTGFIRHGLPGWSSGFSGKKRLSACAKRWLTADRAAAEALNAGLSRAKGLVEPACVPTLARHLPEATTLFVASSMPVRDLEYFWPLGTGRQRVKFNRGANGIDGTLSTALGVAHGDRLPAVLLTGDLALLHDTNGFLSVPKFRGSLTIVLINNNGGGIFGHLPVAQFDPPFEEFFATPQEADFSKLCTAYGVAHTLVKSMAQLGRLVRKLPQRGVRVLELRTDRKKDAAFRKALFAAVAAALE